MPSLNTSRFGQNGVKATFLLVISVFTVIAAACSSGESAEPTTELPSPQEALDNALAAMSEVPQFEFELTHPEGTTSLDGGLKLRRAEGAVITPGHLKVNAEANLGRIFVKVDAVVIKGQTWMTNPLTGNWATVAPEDSPFSFLDPVRLVTNVLARTTTPAYPASGGLSGGQIVLNGQVPSEALQPLVGTVIPGVLLDATLSLDPDTFLLNSARLTGSLQPDDEANYVRLIRFSGFEAALVIEPPI